MLAQLIDADVLAIIREKLTPEQIALLIVEAVNPHRDLSVNDQAKRDGVSRYTISRNR